jgi:hypothetical protein
MAQLPMYHHKAKRVHVEQIASADLRQQIGGGGSQPRGLLDLLSGDS